jgi:MHS family proline/betaine transporter-like MFS transporter
LAELFPTPVRYTGFALSFNMANALLGGTAPFVATWLIAVTGSNAAPAWYLTVIAVGALGAMLLSKETAFQDLRD